MSFSKFWQCCFPKNREQVIENKEESYDIKYTSEEKKVDTTKKRSSKEETEPLSKTRGEKREMTVSSNAPYHEHKKSANNDIVGSFTSFGGRKLDAAGTVKNNVENSINILKDLGTKKDNQIEINTNTSYTTTNNNTNVNANINNSNINKMKVDDSTIDIINSQRVITDEEIKNAPELIFEEVSGEMLKNNKLVINAAGLSSTSGLRKAKDGLVFFGSSSKNVKF